MVLVFNKIMKMINTGHQYLVGQIDVTCLRPGILRDKQRDQVEKGKKVGDPSATLNTCLESSLKTVGSLHFTKYYFVPSK